MTLLEIHSKRFYLFLFKLFAFYSFLFFISETCFRIILTQKRWLTVFGLCLQVFYLLGDENEITVSMIQITQHKTNAIHNLQGFSSLQYFLSCYSTAMK